MQPFKDQTLDQTTQAIDLQPTRFLDNTTDTLQGYEQFYVLLSIVKE